MEILTRLKRLVYGDNINPLPKAIVITLVILNMMSAMTVTTVFDYLPKLVKSYGISEVNTGAYAGYIASSYQLGRAAFLLVWAKFADGKKAKLALVINGIGCVTLPLVFGISKDFVWAMISRIMQGAFCGIPLIVKLIAWDICDETNVTLGLAIIMSSYPIGLIIGPGLAGYLVFPHDLYPSAFKEGTFFYKYPIFLPNLLLAVGFFICVILVIVFIPRTQKERKPSNAAEKKPLLSEENKKPSYQALPPSETVTTQNKTGFRATNIYAVLSSTKCLLCCMVYASYSFTVIGYAEILPVWAATSKDFSGMGFDPSDIGLMLLTAGAFLVLFQYTIQARITSYFGIIETYVASTLLKAAFVLLTPLSHFIMNDHLKYMFLYACQTIVRLTVGSSFLCLTFLLNNSIVGKLRGTANGLSMTSAAIAMALAPTVVGKLFTWSLTNIPGHPEHDNPLGFPFDQNFVFYIIALISMFNAFVVSRFPKEMNVRRKDEEK